MNQQSLRLPERIRKLVKQVPLSWNVTYVTSRASELVTPVICSSSLSRRHELWVSRKLYGRINPVGIRLRWLVAFGRLWLAETRDVIFSDNTDAEPGMQSPYSWPSEEVTDMWAIDELSTYVSRPILADTLAIDFFEVAGEYKRYEYGYVDLAQRYAHCVRAHRHGWLSAEILGQIRRLFGCEATQWGGYVSMAAVAGFFAGLEPLAIDRKQACAQLAWAVEGLQEMLALPFRLRLRSLPTDCQWIVEN